MAPVRPENEQIITLGCFRAVVWSEDGEREAAFQLLSQTATVSRRKKTNGSSRLTTANMLFVYPALSRRSRLANCCCGGGGGSPRKTQVPHICSGFWGGLDQKNHFFPLLEQRKFSQKSVHRLVPNGDRYLGVSKILLTKHRQK